MRANGRLVLTSHERGDFLMACQKPVRDFGTGCQTWMALMGRSGPRKRIWRVPRLLDSKTETCARRLIVDEGAKAETMCCRADVTYPNSRQNVASN